MSEVVNLRQFRKAKGRADKATQAEVNRVKFGRSKAERKMDAADRARSDNMLEGSRLCDDEE